MWIIQATILEDNPENNEQNNDESNNPKHSRMKQGKFIVFDEHENAET